MDDRDHEEKIARITNPDKSKKARQAHKKYGSSYRKCIRKQEREDRNPTLRDMIDDLKEVLSFEQEE